MAEVRFPEIERLAECARREREAFDPPRDPPDETRAMVYLSEGFWPTLAVYLEARTGGSPARFDPNEFATLQSAMNDWLALYAACYGVEASPDHTIRTAAEVFVDTHDLRDTAAVLTHVP
jgi:hypothetical protein